MSTLPESHPISQPPIQFVPEGLTNIECAVCGAFVTFLELTRRGRKRSNRQQKILASMLKKGLLTCSETCTVALMQR